MMIGVSLLIVFATVFSLNFFTRHGQSFVVPDLTGITLQQLESLTQKYGFEFEIIDSVFDENNPAGTILNQDPKPNATVKQGRKFYITIVSSMPDMIEMPNLIDLSLRHATSTLELAGLRLGSVTYQAGSFQNAVLEQIFKGQSIAPGQKIRRGSHINLVVSGSKEDLLNEESIEEEPQQSEENQFLEDL